MKRIFYLFLVIFLTAGCSEKKKEVNKEETISEINTVNEDEQITDSIKINKRVIEAINLFVKTDSSINKKPANNDIGFDRYWSHRDEILKAIDQSKLFTLDFSKKINEKINSVKKEDPNSIILGDMNGGFLKYTILSVTQNTNYAKVVIIYTFSSLYTGGEEENMYEVELKKEREEWLINVVRLI